VYTHALSFLHEFLAPESPQNGVWPLQNGVWPLKKRQIIFTQCERHENRSERGSGYVGSLKYARGATGLWAEL
jgi:hypothetical protein